MVEMLQYSLEISQFITEVPYIVAISSDALTFNSTVKLKDIQIAYSKLQGRKENAYLGNAVWIQIIFFCFFEKLFQNKFS